MAGEKYAQKKWYWCTISAQDKIRFKKLPGKKLGAMERELYCEALVKTKDRIKAASEYKLLLKQMVYEVRYMRFPPGLLSMMPRSINAEEISLT